MEIAAQVATVLIGIAAVVGLNQTRRQSRHQQEQARYTSQQAEALNNVLLRVNEVWAREAETVEDESEKPTRKRLEARFSITVAHTGSSKAQLVITNVGDGSARNVQLTIEDGSPREEQRKGFRSPVVGPTQHPLIRPGEQWRLPLAITFGTPPFLAWRLQWVNGDGTHETDEGVLSWIG